MLMHYASIEKRLIDFPSRNRVDVVANKLGNLVGVEKAERDFPLRLSRLL